MGDPLAIPLVPDPAKRQPDVQENLMRSEKQLKFERSLFEAEMETKKSQLETERMQFEEERKKHKLLVNEVAAKKL